MTDKTAPAAGAGPKAFSGEKPIIGDRVATAPDPGVRVATAPDPGVRGTRRRHPAARARFAAAGVGIAAMVGLAANMQVTSGRTQGAGGGSTSATPPQKMVVIVHNGVKPGSKAAKASKPIVLTAHAVVRTVSAPSSGGSGGSGGSAYVAPPAAAAPAAAPVASTGGSAAP